MSMFGPRQGTWWLHSESDPRWNASGTTKVGGFARPKPSIDKQAELEKLYGEPPTDLVWGYEKD
jgi:hypothetical protein